MKKLLFSVALVTLSFINYAQVGVGTENPQAALDVVSTTDGLLIPRVALTATTSALPLTAPTVSEMVYNNATVSDVTPGYYYWDGARWVRLATGRNWSTTGNAGTDASTSFIGTTDNVDLKIRTNNTEKLKVDTNGNVVIGSSMTPTATAAKLNVTGAGNTIRVENLNKTNNPTVFTNTDLEPIFVNIDGDFVVGGATTKLAVNAIGATAIPTLAINSSNGASARNTIHTTTLTLTKKSLVTITYQTSVTMLLANGNAIIDGAPRIYGTYIIVGLSGATADPLNLTTFRYGYNNATYLNTVISGTIANGNYVINGTTHIEMPAGTHTIKIVGFVYGGSYSVRGTFGGSAFESVQVVTAQQ